MVIINPILMHSMLQTTPQLPTLTQMEASPTAVQNARQCSMTHSVKAWFQPMHQMQQCSSIVLNYQSPPTPKRKVPGNTYIYIWKKRQSFNSYTLLVSKNKQASLTKLYGSLYHYFLQNCYATGNDKYIFFISTYLLVSTGSVHQNIHGHWQE